MLQALPGKAIIKKIQNEQVRGGIFLSTNNYYYQIQSILDNAMELQKGDNVIVNEDNIYLVIHDNAEYGIVDIEDILAVIK